MSNQLRKTSTQRLPINTLSNRGGSARRPHRYDRKIGEYICDELMKGRSLTRICEDKLLPHIVTVLHWKNPMHRVYNEEFSKMYEEALKTQAEVLAFEIKDISDDNRNDTYTYWDRKKGKMVTSVNHDIVERSKIRIKSRQWLAGKHNKKYSDKLEVTGKDGEDLIKMPTKLVVHFIDTDKISKEIDESEKEK